jgi:CO/xanthine dehydrogenase Mo-binding subunit
LGCDASEIVLRGGCALRAAGDGEDDGIPLAELVRRGADDTGALEVKAVFQPAGAAWSSGAHLVALELDRETGATRILRYLIVHDSGAVLDEGAVQRQILGAAAQGIGGALSELIVYDETGQPLVATMADFGMLRAPDMPAIETVRLETPSPHNPLGLKGAGESGCMPVYAALAAAVEDAVGDPSVEVRTLPLPRQAIWGLLAPDKEEA